MNGKICRHCKAKITEEYFNKTTPARSETISWYEWNALHRFNKYPYGFLITSGDILAVLPCIHFASLGNVENVINNYL